MSMNELNQVGRDLLAIKQMIEELQQEAEALTDTIKQAMYDRGEEVISCPNWKASWRNITSSRVDTTALKKAMPDVAQQFTKTTTTCRFTINATV